MDIDSLNYFINVAECLSFAQAAKRLYISQSTLSNRIAALEKELGASLFERTTRSVSLTAAGEYFLAEAKNITNHFGEVTLHTRELAAGSQGSLKVGYLDFLGYDIVERTIMDYHKAYPGISIDIVKMNYPTLLKNMNDMSVDIGLPVQLVDGLPQALCGTPLLTSRLRVLMRKDHPLAAKTSIKLSEIKDEPLLIVEKKSAEVLNEIVSVIFARQNLVPRVVLECYGPEELALAVTSGMGIAIVSSFMTASIKKSDFLCTVPLSYILDTTQMCLITHRDNPNPCIQSFLETAQKTAQDLCLENPAYAPA